jgi:hypothetical protein
LLAGGQASVGVLAFRHRNLHWPTTLFPQMRAATTTQAPPVVVACGDDGDHEEQGEAPKTRLTMLATVAADESRR